jgi:hypothetical protein
MADSEGNSVDRRGFLKGLAVGAATPAAMHAQDHDHQDVPPIYASREGLGTLLVEKGLRIRRFDARRHHGAQSRSAQRSAGRGARLGRPRVQKRLLENAPAAIAELGYTSGQGEHMVVVENGPKVQPDRLHSAPVIHGPFSVSARLVQVRALSLSRGHRPAGHPPRVRNRRRGRRRGARLGQHGGAARIVLPSAPPGRKT